MEYATIIGALGILVVLGAVQLWRSHFSEERAVRQELEAAPRTPIGQVGTGPVCVKGKVSRRETTTVAPLSGNPCIAWVVMVRDKSTDWAPVTGDCMVYTCDFWITDDTGRAVVETTETLKIASRRTTSWNAVSLSAEAHQKLERLLKEQDSWLWNVASNPFVHFEEGILKEGDIATVVGHATRVPDVDGEREGLREPPTIATIRSGGSNEPLLINFDD